MAHRLKKEKNHSYIKVGEDTTMIILHGLMGGRKKLSVVTAFISKNGYNFVIP